jgi:hypothetical protein
MSGQANTLTLYLDIQQTYTIYKPHWYEARTACIYMQSDQTLFYGLFWKQSFPQTT